MRSLPFYFHLKILDNCFELTLCQSRFTKPFKCPSSWVISQPNKVLNHTRLILRVKEFLLRVEGFFLLKLSDFSFEMNYQLLLPSNGIKYWTIWGSFWGRKSSSWGLRDFFVAVYMLRICYGTFTCHSPMCNVHKHCIRVHLR